MWNKYIMVKWTNHNNILFHHLKNATKIFTLHPELGLQAYQLFNNMLYNINAVLLQRLFH